jgi:predicted TIM-barrel fold metal-dependent hydrolase
VTLGVIVDSTRALEALSESAISPAIRQTRWFFLGNALPASVSLQSEMQILCAKNIDDVVIQLAETPVFFLIAYLKNEKLADELFQKRDELYTLANYNPNEDESN